MVDPFGEHLVWVHFLGNCFSIMITACSILTVIWIKQPIHRIMAWIAINPIYTHILLCIGPAASESIPAGDKVGELIAYALDYMWYDRFFGNIIIYWLISLAIILCYLIYLLIVWLKKTKVTT